MTTADRRPWRRGHKDGIGILVGHGIDRSQKRIAVWSQLPVLLGTYLERRVRQSSVRDIPEHR
jgi:hypothetical protein